MLKRKLYFICLLAFQLIYCQNLLANGFLKNALMNLSSILQSLTERSLLYQSKEEKKESTTDNPPFRIWNKADYSVVQIHVLDQFLTVEQFLKQKTASPQEIENLPTIFKHPEEIESPSQGAQIKAKGTIEFTLDRIQKAQELLKKEISESKVSPSLNLGGGEESCGYQAIKNALYIISRIEYEPSMFLILNDSIEANNLFGTYAINELLNIRPVSIDSVEEGPWRKIVVEHRISLKEDSIKNALKKVQQTFEDIEENIKKIHQLIEQFNISENIKIKNDIQKIWETISSDQNTIASEVLASEMITQEIDTETAKNLNQKIALLSTKTKELVTSTHEIIPLQQLNELKTEEPDPNIEEKEEKSEINEEEEFDIDDDESDFENYEEEEEENFNEEEDEEAFEDEEPSESLETYKSSLNLEQSEKEGNNLDVSDLDFLYDRLKEKYGLPESTTIGSAELGVEPLETQDPIELEVAQQLFDRIVAELSKDSLKQHIIFVGGGGHWASIVIRIINNKPYYIITDSTNEMRYGVDLKQKGIFITKAIQKIIDGTKDSLLKLNTASS